MRGLGLIAAYGGVLTVYSHAKKKAAIAKMIATKEGEERNGSAALEQPHPDLVGQCIKRRKIEPCSGTCAIDACQIPFRSVRHDIKCGIGAGETCRQAHQTARIGAFRREHWHQRT